MKPSKTRLQKHFEHENQVLAIAEQLKSEYESEVRGQENYLLDQELARLGCEG